MATKPRTQPTPAVPQPSARLAISDATLAELNLDHGTWRVLTESIFPSAVVSHPDPQTTGSFCRKYSTGDVIFR
ncbi:hypothetical protein [Thiocapsa rosea]|uniref:Uncharacterized protein n=1 Tax=Thiocapsa rosea TaxID=69360 RepID=A0A495VAH4_9GAMM|nr:hypothetical protein [Thiocapsa rosea]RKT45367.1 hypothetical protein BDD21_2814 [Thiocapsa rosea]